MKLILALLAISCVALPARAQLGIYGGFTTSTLTTANTPRLNGGTFGLFYDGHHFPIVNFGIDARVVALPTTDNVSVTTFTVGPRAVIHLPRIPIRPYAEITVGGGSVKYGTGGTGSYNDGGGAFSAIAGADLRLLSHVDWRVLDYSFTRLVGPHANQHNLTTGVVLHF